MQSSLCHILRFSFFPLWTTVNSCLPNSIPPTPNPVVTMLGTNVGPQLRTPAVEVIPTFHTFSSFSSPCFLFTFIASLFCSVTFYTMFVPKVKPPEVLLGMRQMLLKIRKMLAFKELSNSFISKLVKAYFLYVLLRVKQKKVTEMQNTAPSERKPIQTAIETLEIRISPYQK